MNAKIMIAIIATFAMLFAGVAVASESAGIADGSGEEPTTVTGPIPFYAEFGPDKIVKWFNLDSTDGTIVLPTPEALGITIPEGYTFNGWYAAELNGEDTEADTDGACYNPGTRLTLSDDYGFFANITANTYSIVFKDASGEVITKFDKATEGYEPSKLKLNDEFFIPTKEYSTPEVGQIFVGWIDENGNVLTADADGRYTVKGNAIYTATFKADVKVTFVVDGTITYTGYVNTVPYPTDPVKESFTFVGWDVNGTVVLKAGCTEKDLRALGLEADTTFTAVFEPAIYTVSFVVDGDVVATQTVKHGELATEPAFIPALEGMDFVEWDFDFAQAITGDTTIVAVFEPTPEPEPTGLDNPTVQIMAIIIGVLAVFVVAMLVWKKDDVRAIIVKKLDKNKNQEEPKQ